MEVALIPVSLSFFNPLSACFLLNMFSYRTRHGSCLLVYAAVEFEIFDIAQTTLFLASYVIHI